MTPEDAIRAVSARAMFVVIPDILSPPVLCRFSGPSLAQKGSSITMVAGYYPDNVAKLPAPLRSLYESIA
jgi:hypothetical protein